MKWFVNSRNDPFRQIGYAHDQQGIMRRYLREGENWHSHLENSKRYIVQFCRQLQQSESIAILGSGWLLDVPLEFLLERFERIYLVDICHPTQIRHKMSKEPRIVLVEKDLTGLAHLLPDILKGRELSDERISDLAETLPDQPEEMHAGALISLNLLTQLDGIIHDYIQRKKIPASIQQDRFRKTLQERHLNLLSRFPSCLITDTHELLLDDKEQLVSSSPTLLANWPEGKHARGWTWKFDSQKTFHEQYKTFLRVEATMLL